MADITKEGRKKQTIEALKAALEMAEQGKLQLIEVSRPAFEGLPFTCRRFEPGPDLYLHLRYDEFAFVELDEG